jgi:hypothetical protein
MERPDLTVANFDFTFLEIVVPYFCFYSGNILLTLVKDTLSKQSGEKPQLVADYCTAMENRTFSARKNLIDKTLNGQPCIESWKEAYKSPLAKKFDPISTEITSRMMCQEFVTEINTLLDMQKSNIQNAVRYSYAISQQVDLETQQIDTFASCVSLEAEKDPR